MLAPGLHENLPFTDYMALDAVSFHRLSDLRRSPAACKMRMESPPEPTDAQTLGTAFHMLLLEPHLFSETFQVLKFDGRTREGKDEREEMKAKGLQPLSRTYSELAYGMAQSIQSHPRVAKLLVDATAREQSAIWQAPRSGRLCKARRDLVGQSWVADFKSAADIDRFSPWTVTSLGYYRQAAWYALPEENLGLPPVQHFFLCVVVSTPPHEAQVFRLTEQAWTAGRQENERLLDLYLKCEEQGIWPRHNLELGEADISWTRSSELSAEGGSL